MKFFIRVLPTIIAALVVLGCTPKTPASIAASTMPAAPMVAISPVAKWRVVQVFEGESIKNTPIFDIPSNEWRISWQASPTKMGDGLFSVTVNRGDGSHVGLIANIVGKGEDMGYFYEGGSFYLEIMASEKYTITIESQ